MQIFLPLLRAVSVSLSVLPLAALSQEFQSAMGEVANKYEIPQSWVKAKVFPPNSLSPTSIESLMATKPENIVVHLHGCGGISPDEIAWAKILSSGGYTVILPDSLAIPGRKSNCEVGSKNRNMGNVPVGPLRVSEARYALNQITKIDSVKNVFLMGHSEGGATILMAPMANYRGVVSIGSFCSGPKVNISNDVPLLLINHQNDPWFKDVQYLCDEKTVHRSKNTQAIVLSGTGHEASQSAIAQTAVLEFLRANSR